MSSLVDVVVVNFNAGPQLRDGLAALREVDTAAFVLGRVVVVDNASSDHSADDLDVPGVPLVIRRNLQNRGFAAACNQGAAGSRADYLLFLNPDARVFSDSIDQAVALMERPEHARTAVCGIQLVDGEGNVSRTCARLPTPALFFSHTLGLDRIFPRHFPSHFMAEWDHGQSREVDHVIGAFYLIRRATFEQLGGFDERFFVYLEDLDLSARVRALGHRCWYLAGAQAYHRGGGTSEQVRASRLFYAIHSRILYGHKHFGRVSATGLMLAAMLVEPVIRLAFALSRGAGRQVIETAQAYGLLWRRAPALLKMAVHRDACMARPTRLT